MGCSGAVERQVRMQGQARALSSLVEAVSSSELVSVEPSSLFSSWLSSLSAGLRACGFSGIMPSRLERQQPPVLSWRNFPKYSRCRRDNVKRFVADRRGAVSSVLELVWNVT